MQGLPQLSEIHVILSTLCQNSISDPKNVEDVEKICVLSANWLRSQNLTTSKDNFLIAHSNQLMEKVNKYSLEE